MKKVFLLVFAAIVVSLASFAQEAPLPYRSIFVEVGGAGLPYSFNYDIRFDKTKMDSWGMRVGIGGYATRNDSFFSLPFMVNKLYGKSSHYFEIGLGATIFGFDENDYRTCVNGFVDQNGNFICNSYETYKSNYEFILPVDGSPSVMGTMNFGYRKIPVDGGFTWRINLTPIFNNNGFWPLFAGLGFGYSF
jgi:hypothetical protein